MLSWQSATLGGTAADSSSRCSEKTLTGPTAHSQSGHATRCAYQKRHKDSLRDLQVSKENQQVPQRSASNSLHSPLGHRAKRRHSFIKKHLKDISGRDRLRV